MTAPGTPSNMKAETLYSRFARLRARAVGRGLPVATILDEVLRMEDAVMALAEALGMSDPRVALVLNFDLDKALAGERPLGWD